MKKIRSLLSLVMVLSLCLTMPPITFPTMAATDGYLSYSITNGEVTITDCDTAVAGSFTIPATIEGYPVTTIGRSAFSYCKNLTHLTVPEGVTSIEYQAFCDCSALVTREYTVIITDADAILDLMLCQLGDINGNGKINMGDIAQIYAHVKRTALLTDSYQLLCADFNGDGIINIGDTARAYSNIKK